MHAVRKIRVINRVFGAGSRLFSFFIKTNSIFQIYIFPEWYNVVCIPWERKKIKKNYQVSSICVVFFKLAEVFFDLCTTHRFAEPNP